LALSPTNIAVSPYDLNHQFMAFACFTNRKAVIDNGKFLAVVGVITNNYCPKFSGLVPVYGFLLL
jgi:hypothetical protein